MSTYISLSAAFAQWQELAADIPKDDGPALAESWNDYTDSLAKDGQLCALQYHYCPAYDDEMPGDGSRWDALSDDREFILERMGVVITSKRINARNDIAAGTWDKDASHWRVSVARNGKSYGTGYSMGSAHKGEPEAADVLNSLLLDASIGAGTLAEYFDEFGEPEGYKEHIQAERMHQACVETNEWMRELFTAKELEDLRDLFEGM